MRGIFFLPIFWAFFQLPTSLTAKPQCQGLLKRSSNISPLSPPSVISFLRAYEKELLDSGLPTRFVNEDSLFLARPYQGGEPFYVVKAPDNKIYYFTSKPQALDLQNHKRWGVMEGAGPGRFTGLKEGRYLLHTEDVLILLRGRPARIFPGQELGPQVVQELLQSGALSEEQRPYVQAFQNELQEIINSYKIWEGQALVFS
ncbi:MAG: hypothetical protein D6797_01200, partial [Bdellovibrio sp.]